MTDQRPNFIVLVGEDTGLHLGCYGNTYASTPHLDGLAKRGRQYTNAISTAPVCSPSRCSMVTGCHPWSIGTHHHRSQLLNPPRLFTEELRDAGYYVNWANKTDFNFDPPQAFADERRDWLADLANDTLSDQPFLLFHNFSVTHESTMWRWHNNNGACAERINQQHRLHDDQHHDPADAPVPAYLPDVPEVRADIARYFDALSIQDAQIGDVLAAIDESPRREKTYVIYLTDHGRGLLLEKRWCYEAGLHLPLIMAGPGIEAGAIDESVVSWVDLAPTILSLAGVPMPEHYEGRPFMGPRRVEREFAFAGRGRMDETYDMQRAARDQDYLYVRNGSPELPYAQPNIYEMNQLTTQVLRELGARGKVSGPAAKWLSATKPPEELYDVRRDPDCVVNLATSAEHAGALARMRDGLDEHLTAIDDLGTIPERELIARGLVKDVLGEMDKRRIELKPPYQIGPNAKCALETPG
jgi:N-sulfoglucosamine sulfohydrolase